MQTPSSPKSTILSMMDFLTAKSNTPDTCQRHNVEMPCLLCQDEEREMLKRDEALRQKHLKELRENPERILKNIGIGKIHLTSSLDNYEGADGLKKICQDCIDAPFNLLFFGPPGCGKTHLAVAIIRELICNGSISSKNVKFTTASELLFAIKVTYREGAETAEEKLVFEYGSVDLLVLDDLGSENPTDWAISTLYLIIDRRYRQMRPTICTSNLTVSGIASQLSPRIASRLASGKVIELDLPDYRRKKTNRRTP